MRTVPFRITLAAALLCAPGLARAQAAGEPDFDDQPPSRFGTSSFVAQVFLASANALNPGCGGLAQLTCFDPVALRNQALGLVSNMPMQLQAVTVERHADGTTTVTSSGPGFMLPGRYVEARTQGPTEHLTRRPGVGGGGTQFGDALRGAPQFAPRGLGVGRF